MIVNRSLGSSFNNIEVAAGERLHRESRGSGEITLRNLACVGVGVDRLDLVIDHCGLPLGVEVNAVERAKHTGDLCVDLIAGSINVIPTGEGVAKLSDSA